jgi:hypothetical protein
MVGARAEEEDEAEGGTGERLRRSTTKAGREGVDTTEEDRGECADYTGI